LQIGLGQVVALLGNSAGFDSFRLFLGEANHFGAGSVHLGRVGGPGFCVIDAIDIGELQFLLVLSDRVERTGFQNIVKNPVVVLEVEFTAQISVLFDSRNKRDLGHIVESFSMEGIIKRIGDQLATSRALGHVIQFDLYLLGKGRILCNHGECHETKEEGSG